MSVRAHNISQNLTSYDLLKTFAVLTMVVDHIGAYLFPDIQELRFVGRLSYPVWFFLIGYARSRDIPLLFFVGGAVLTLARGMVVGSFAPLNILFTFAFIRAMQDRYMPRALTDRMGLCLFLGGCILLSVPSYFMLEYGTLGMLFAGFGYMCRHGKMFSLSVDEYMFWGIATVSIATIIQAAIFGFPQSWAVGLYVLYAAQIVVLYKFKPNELDKTHNRLPSFITAFLQFCGRRSFEIYIYHVLLFIALGLALGVLSLKIGV